MSTDDLASLQVVDDDGKTKIPLPISSRNILYLFMYYLHYLDHIDDTPFDEQWFKLTQRDFNDFRQSHWIKYYRGKTLDNIASVDLVQVATGKQASAANGSTTSLAISKKLDPVQEFDKGIKRTPAFPTLKDEGTGIVQLVHVLAAFTYPILVIKMLILVTGSQRLILILLSVLLNNKLKSISLVLACPSTSGKICLLKNSRSGTSFPMLPRWLSCQDSCPLHRDHPLARVLHPVFHLLDHPLARVLHPIFHLLVLVTTLWDPCPLVLST